MNYYEKELVTIFRQLHTINQGALLEHAYILSEQQNTKLEIQKRTIMQKKDNVLWVKSAEA